MPSFPDFFLRATRLLFGLGNHVVKAVVLGFQECAQMVAMEDLGNLGFRV